MAKRKKRHHEEDHPDETWLVPYSDVLTLLLALFIVLFASSTIDAKKFEQMMQTFAIEFNGGGMSGILDGGVKPIEQGGKSEKQIKTEDTAKPDVSESESNNKGNKYHDNGIEFCKPSYDNCSKAFSACRAC